MLQPTERPQPGQGFLFLVTVEMWPSPREMDPNETKATDTDSYLIRWYSWHQADWVQIPALPLATV